MQDYYKILGVNEDADEKEIKKAYTTLAKKWHPDNFATQKDKIYEAEDKMKEINAAYEVLKNPEKRKEYDLSCRSFTDYNGYDPYADILRQMFRDKMNGTMTRRGNDVNINISINLEDVLTGVNKSINFYHIVNCDSCQGTGAKDKLHQIKCNRCHGLGFDFTNVNQSCSKCHGKGRIPLVACSKCNGTGTIKIKDNITLHIPKGIKDGMKLRISNKGDIGTNQQYGNLIITVNINKHPIFTRENNNLLMNVDINYIDAILGCTKIVQTLDGYIDIKIPQYSQPNDVIVIKSKGLPQNNTLGDLKCKLNVLLPKELNDEQIEILKQLR